MYLEPSPVQECNSKAVFVCAAALLGGRSLSSSSRSVHVRNTPKLHRFQHTPAVQRVLTSWIDLTLTFQEAEVEYWFVLSHYLRKDPAAQSAVPTSQITCGLCLAPCQGFCVGGHDLRVKERAAWPQFRSRVGAFLIPANAGQGDWGPGPPLFQITGDSDIGFPLQCEVIVCQIFASLVWAVKGRSCVSDS